jgi:hypothetical protein
MKNNVIKTIASSMVVGAFIFLAYGSDDDSSPADDKADALEDVKYSGRTAIINYEIEAGTFLAQYLHEEIILEKIYHIFMDNKADKIKITIHDYCKDSYGNNNKRTWHKTIDKSWLWWEDAYKYADVKAFYGALGKYYTISSEMDEGTFYCCGRDRNC